MPDVVGAAVENSGRNSQGHNFGLKSGRSKLKVLKALKIKTPKALMRMGMGRETSPLHLTREVWGSIMSSPSGVWGVFELSKHVLDAYCKFWSVVHEHCLMLLVLICATN